MRATDLNHISIHAVDLEASIHFYETFFGMRRIATPRFEAPAQWLQMGSIQIHLFERAPQEAPHYHHLALTVDDFSAFHEESVSRGIQDTETFGFDVRELPDGSLQMYIRDPAGNLIEINCKDASPLRATLRADVTRLEDQIPQPAEAREATLFSRS